MDELAGRLVLPFDTDSADFARGFEAGALWSDLKATEESIEAVMHTSSIEMAMRMAEALHRPLVGDVLDDTWTRATFGAVAEPPSRLG